MRAFLTILAVLAGGLLMQPAAAEPSQARPAFELGNSLRKSSSITPREAAQRAERQYGGRALSVDPTDAGFRVKLLKGGDVHTVYISP